MQSSNLHGVHTDGTIGQLQQLKRLKVKLFLSKPGRHIAGIKYKTAHSDSRH